MTHIPDNSKEAEQSVLGALMIDAESNRNVIEQLTEEHFKWDEHKAILKAIQHLYSREQDINVLTVDDYLTATDAPEDCDMAYVNMLAEETRGITGRQVWSYYKILEERMIRRRVLEASHSVSESAKTMPDIEAVLDTSQVALNGLFLDQGCETEQIRTTTERVIAEIDHLYHREGGDLIGITTGFDDMDKMTMGLPPGLHILAGRPKMGKTTIAMNLCENAALAGHACGIFSLEMSKEMLTKKSIASLGGINYDRLRNPKLMEDEDFPKLAKAAKFLNTLPIHFFGGMQTNVRRVKSAIRQWCRNTPDAKMVMIDYLQLMDHHGNGNLTDIIGETTRQLKLLADELGLAILLLSQLSRDVEKRPNKRPVNSDLRSSGSIEQDADSTWFIYRDEVYDEDSRYKGIAELICGVSRHFEPGTIYLASQLQYQRFQNLAAGQLPKEEPPRIYAKKPL